MAAILIDVPVNIPLSNIPYVVTNNEKVNIVKKVKILVFNLKKAYFFVDSLASFVHQNAKRP